MLSNRGAEVPRAPWVALCQDSSPRRGLRHGGRGQKLAGEPAGHVLQHHPHQGGSQMHRPWVCAPLCRPTVAKTAPGGPQGADGSQGRQCGQGAGERRLLRHSIWGQRCESGGEAEALEPIRAAENLLGCEAWPLEASFLYLQKQPFTPTVQSCCLSEQTNVEFPRAWQAHGGSTPKAAGNSRLVTELVWQGRPASPRLAP